MSLRCCGLGLRHAARLLLAPLLLLPQVSQAAVGAAPRLLDTSLLQAAQAARAAQAVAEAAAQAAFLAPAARVLPSAPSPARAGAQAPYGALGGLAARAPSQGLQAASPPATENVQLRQENDRLRHERAQLAEDVLRLERLSTVHEAQWQRDRERLTREDNELRREDTQLRREDSNLRQALARASAGSTGRRSAALLFTDATTTTMSKRGRVMFVIFAMVAVGCACSVYCFGSCMFEDTAVESEDDDVLMDLVANTSSRSASCAGCLRCLCRPYVLMCSGGLAFASTIFGLVLWEMGLLQPIISQLLVYAYIMGVVVLLVATLAYEIWYLVARAVRMVLEKVNNPLVKAIKARKNLLGKRHKYLDWFDDGEHNPVLSSDPAHWGDRERRNALRQARQNQTQRGTKSDSLFR